MEPIPKRFASVSENEEEVDQIFADLPVTTPNPTVESQTTGFDIDMLLSSATATEVASVETPQPPQPSPFVYNFQGARISKEPMLCSISLNKINKVTQLQLAENHKICFLLECTSTMLRRSGLPGV